MKETSIKRFHSSRYEKSYVGVTPWLNAMYSSIYFSTCVMHQNAKKNDLDHFCIDCRRSLCSNCLPSHDMHHKHVKIRRYVYNDVVNRQDLCKLFNCSGIQLITIFPKELIIQWGSFFRYIRHMVAEIGFWLSPYECSKITGQYHCYKCLLTFKISKMPTINELQEFFRRKMLDGYNLSNLHNNNVTSDDLGVMLIVFNRKQ
ncbi:protein RGF1 INDUCIBLE TRANSCRIPTION FACTOR 1-like isoform X2 [Fagus crenata]